MMFEAIPPPEKPSIWLHAVSVGEVEAALPVARKIIERYGSGHLLFTTTTKEGWDVARKKLDGLKHLQYYPFDFPAVVEKFVKHYQPSLYICMETELWPIMLYSLKTRGIPIMLANGRISDRLNQTRPLLKPLYRWIFSSFDWIGLQTDEDMRRLVGFSSELKNVEVVGNTKFDLPDPRLNPLSLDALKKELGLKDGAIITFGSTHPGEEEMICRTYLSWRIKLGKITMIIAPRHIDRVSEIAEILERNVISYRLRTSTRPGIEPLEKVDCVILDTVGELTKIYALGEIAFVGGSLIKRGGHNLLEPAAAGIPVLHGPYMDNFRAITSFLHNAGAAIEIADETELENRVLELLSDRDKLKDMKDKARKAYESGKGATDKIMVKVTEFMP